MNELSILSRPVTVVLTSVGNEAIHGFVDDLRRRAPRWRLIGADIRGDAAGLARCDRGVLVPRRDEPGFLDVLADLCRAEGADLLAPLSTDDQDFFCRPEVRARLGLPVMVSSPEAVAAANGKLALFAALRGHPELLPEHRVVRDPAEATQALAELIRSHGAALLKTDRGSGGAGMLCIGPRPSDPAPTTGRRWLSLDEAREIFSCPTRAPATTWPRQAVAWLPGAEYSVDLLGDRGEPLGGAVRLRRAAVGGMATDAETVDEADVLAAATLILRELGLSFVNNIQLRRDAEGRPRLMEINPRIPGTIGLTVEAGLNLPLAAFCLALGERLPLPEPEIGVRVLRHAGAVYLRGRFEATARGSRAMDARPTAGVGESGPTAPSGAPDGTTEPETEPVVVWDLDGTLVRLEIARDVIARWKDEIGRRLEPHGWRGGLSPLLPSLERALDELSPRLTPTAASRLRAELYDDLDRWEDEAIRSIEPIDGAIEHFRACAEAGIAMAVVSNSGPRAVARGLEVIRGRLEARGVRWPPLVVVHRHPLLRAKPSPAMFLAALEALVPVETGLPRRVVVVGDSPHDEQAARALARRCLVPVAFVEARVGRLTTRDDGLLSHPLLRSLVVGDTRR